MLSFRSSAALVLVSGAALAQTPGRPAEKVRVTYEASAGCPGTEAFLAQVRARVGTDWEAPPNELARTIEVRVTGAGGKSIARIDFVDENNQPISRVVTAKTCDEVVTGIALVTALAIESRIAEAVGKSEPLAAPSGEPTVEPTPPPTAARAPEATSAAPTQAPTAVRPPPEPSGPPPHFDVGGGVIASAGALPGVSFGGRGFLGLGWSAGPDFRLGGDFASAGTVKKTVGADEYTSRFTQWNVRASACPFAFGDTVRLLPCGGVEFGRMHAEGIASSSTGGLKVEGGEENPLWLAPFVTARADATWEILFVELDVSLAFPVLPLKREFEFQRQPPPNAVVHTIWPVSPGAALNVGLRL